MHTAQAILVNVRIDLGGGHVGMAEHFLHAAQVGAALEQM